MVLEGASQLPFATRSLASLIRNGGAFFLSASVYTNTGLDLIDQNMIRKQTLRLCYCRKS
jgi:hypothetical protein